MLQRSRGVGGGKLSWNIFVMRFKWEKVMAPYSSTLAWKIPWAEKPGRLQSMGSLRVGHDWATHFHFSLSCIGEGDGTPLQCFAWRILGTGEPGGLPSLGLHRVEHDWSDLAATAAAWVYINTHIIHDYIHREIHKHIWIYVYKDINIKLCIF